MEIGNLLRGTFMVAITTCSALAAAEPPGYNYIEGGAGHALVEAPGSKGDSGYWAGFSARLAGDFYLNGRYGRYDLERYSVYGAGEFELGQFNLGYRLPLGDHTDLNAEIGFSQFDIGDSNEARDDDGSGARGSVGVRLRSPGRMEGRAYLGYTQDQQNFFLGVEGSIPLTRRLGFTLQFEGYEGERMIVRGGLRLGC